MSEQVIAEGENFTAVSTCKLDDLMSVKGKVFVKDQIHSTGSELSISMLEPRAQVPFLHTHKQNEEVYVILKGTGQFQVDDKIFDVKEGDVIRVAPKGKRGLRAGEEALTYICIQAKEGSLEHCTGDDGEILEGEPKWE